MNLGSGNKDLASALARLENAIDLILPGLHRHLSPGLAPEDITALTANRPYLLPNDVAQLYQWHNGEGRTAPYDWNLTGTATIFVPLQNALLDEDGYALRRELLEYDFGDHIPAELDAPGYLVLFEDGGGDEVVVPCWDRKIETSPIFYNPEVGDIAISYGSVADMINTFAACYEEGVHSLRNGEFKTDFHKLHEVSRRLNPEAGHWQEW